MTSTRRIYIAGHRGLLGGALERVLGERNEVEFVHPREGRVDLRDQSQVRSAMRDARPDVVILSAARVGGIGANLADPVGFLTDNLRIELNTIDAAMEAGVERLLFVSSANAYPVEAEQPINEESLGNGAIDADTESYGLSKLVGVRLCDAYRRQHGVRFHSVVPSNLYGPGDRFDRATAHVVAATLRRFEDAVRDGCDEVVVWGTGRQRRQMLYSDDLARACDLLLQLDDPPSWINVGPRGDVEIARIAEIAAEIVGFEGRIEFDPARPEGVVKRELDVTRIHELGWSARIDLETGMRHTWAWYQQALAGNPAAHDKAINA